VYALKHVNNNPKKAHKALNAPIRDSPKSTSLKFGSNLTSGFRGEDLNVKSLWLMTDD
jgi:hypothetical protein